MNRLAYLLAGMAIGAIGMKVAKDAKEGNCAPGLKAVVQGGHNIVEKVMGAAETVKEDVQDYIAEAKFAHEQKIAEQQEAKDAEVEASEEKVAEEPAVEEGDVAAVAPTEEAPVEAAEVEVKEKAPAKPKTTRKTKTK